MRILLHIPAHLHTVPMNGYVASALRALGHEVAVFDGRGDRWRRFFDKAGEKLLRRKDKPLANRLLRRVVEEMKPELFLTIFGFDVAPRTLEFLRAKKIPTACWWLNDPFQFGRSIKKAPLYDFVFTNARDSVAEYRDGGMERAHWLPVGCAPEVHKSVPAEPTFRSEVCFAGDWSPLREEFMLKIAPVCELKIFGPWKKKLKKGSPLLARLTDGFFTPEQMARMFNSAELVLNLHTWYGRFDHGTNPRLFEAAGCGSAQLVDFKREIPELFVPEREIFMYRRLDEVPGMVKALLKDSLALRQLGRAAQRRAHVEHTYQRRMEELLKVVGGK